MGFALHCELDNSTTHVLFTWIRHIQQLDFFSFTSLNNFQRRPPTFNELFHKSKNQTDCQATSKKSRILFFIVVENSIDSVHKNVIDVSRGESSLFKFARRRIIIVHFYLVNS